MEKILAFIDLFRKGEAVDNPEDWENGKVTAAALVPVIMAVNRVATALGHPLPIDEATADTIAAVIIGIASVGMHIITSERLGILPAKQVLQSADTAPAAGVQAQPIPTNQAYAGNDPLGAADRG